LHEKVTFSLELRHATSRDDHGAGVDSGRILHFRPEQEPESIFQVRAGVYIKVCAGANQNF